MSIIQTNSTLSRVLGGLCREHRGGPPPRPVLVAGRFSTGRRHHLLGFARQLCCSGTFMPFSHEGEEDCHCAFCKEMTGPASHDVITLVGGSDGVEQVREALSLAVRSPTCLPIRFLLVEDIHRMSEESLNAMLKLLEEPPQHLSVFATARYASSLPSSVTSRFLWVHHPRPTIGKIEEIRASAGLSAPEDKLAAWERIVLGADIVRRFCFEQSFNEVVVNDDFVEARYRAKNFMERIRGSTAQHISDVIEIWLEWMEWRLRSGQPGPGETITAPLQVFRRGQGVLDNWVHRQDAGSYISLDRQVISLALAINMARKLTT